MNRKFLIILVSVGAAVMLTLVPRSFGADDARLASPLPAHALSFSPDGKWLAAAYGSGNRGELVVWQVAERTPKWILPDKRSIRSVEFSPAGDRLALAGSSNVVKIVSADTGETQRALAGHTKRVAAVSYSADGKLLASSAADQTVRLWNVETGEVVRQFECPGKDIPGVALSPDGRWLAAACEQGNSARLWDLTKPGEAGRLFQLPGYAPQVAFSRDSKHFIVSNYGNNMSLFETASGNEAGCFTNVNSTRETAFSPDGRWVAFGSVLPLVHAFAWQPPPDEEQQREVSELIGKFASDDMSVRDAASKRLYEIGRAAVGQIHAKLDSPDPEVRVRCRRLWKRLNDAESAIKLAGSKLGTDCLAFSPDGELLAGGDFSGAIRIWNMTTQKLETTLERTPH